MWFPEVAQKSTSIGKTFTRETFARPKEFFLEWFHKSKNQKKKKKKKTQNKTKKTKKKRYKLLRMTYFFTWNFVILFVIINLTSKMGMISTNKKVCKSHGIKLEESHLMLPKISETFANWDFRKIMGYKLLRTAILKKLTSYSFAKKAKISKFAKFSLVKVSPIKVILCI